VPPDEGYSLPLYEHDFKERMGMGLRNPIEPMHGYYSDYPEDYPTPPSVMGGLREAVVVQKVPSHAAPPFERYRKPEPTLYADLPFSYHSTVRDDPEATLHPFYSKSKSRADARDYLSWPEEPERRQYAPPPRRPDRETPPWSPWPQQVQQPEMRSEPESVLVNETLDFIRRKLDQSNNKPIPLSTLGNLLAAYRAANSRPKSRSGLLHCLNASEEFEVFNPDREVGKGSGSKLVVRRYVRDRR
jgi:hypothetical protein